MISILACTIACNGTKKIDTASSPTEKSYKLNGNEPFWNIEINNGGITFTQMGSEAIYFPATTAKAGGNNQIYDTSTTIDGKSMEMRIIMESKPCSDTMSDNEYAYKVTVSLNGKTYKGCGNEVAM